MGVRRLAHARERYLRGTTRHGRLLTERTPCYSCPQEEKTYKINHNIALVQSPQSFVDVKSHDPLGQQYRYFYGPVLQG
jgi:hypothetical protein